MMKLFIISDPNRITNRSSVDPALCIDMFFVCVHTAMAAVFHVFSQSSNYWSCFSLGVRHNFVPYCWWFRNPKQTTTDVSELANNGPKLPTSTGEWQPDFLGKPQKTHRLKELKAEQQSFREALLGVFAAQEALRKSLSKTSALVMCETTIWARWGVSPSGREKNSR